MSRDIGGLVMVFHVSIRDVRIGTHDIDLLRILLIEAGSEGCQGLPRRAYGKAPSFRIP